MKHVLAFAGASVCLLASGYVTTDHKPDHNPPGQVKKASEIDSIFGAQVIALLVGALLLAAERSR